MTQAPSLVWRAASAGARSDPLPRGLDAAWHAGAGWAARLRQIEAHCLEGADRSLALEGEVRTLNDARLRERLGDVRAMFRLGRDTTPDSERALALVREAGRRTIGVAAHREQVAGALGLLGGCVAEMATGEGKTLTSAMAATLEAWRGRGVHVLTVNDYLAARDAEWMRPLYAFCGLSAGAVTQDASPEERRRAYGADVTHLTGREAAADFLRDRLALGRSHSGASALLAAIAEGRGAEARLLQRGLSCAIVDEADSVLIDEAVTPLILSGAAPDDDDRREIESCGALAARLFEGEHYRADRARQDVELTRAGRAQVRSRWQGAGGALRLRRRAEEMVVQALLAREFYARGRQYVVQAGKALIVDEFTGRLMPDRRWRDGLHQAVEAREGLIISARQETLASLSFQRFFRLYRRLSGMSGTIAEARGEIWRVYARPVVRIPTHRPCIREQRPDRVFAGEAQKWAAVVEAVAAEHALGRPVLAGVRSVEASERLAGMLAEAGLPHDVLNAQRHAEEAGIIARAGQRGRITIATNMAGRGTDIRLGEGVTALGGLHVIATERHEARRVDRQLFGRAGRQGDPGSAQAFVSLEDDLLVRFSPVGALAMRRRGGESVRGGAGSVIALAQRRAEAASRRQRARVLREDDWLDEVIGHAGRPF